MKEEKNLLIRGISQTTLRAIDRKVDEINATNLEQKRDGKLSRNQFIISILDEQKDVALLEYQKSVFDKKVDSLLDLMQEYIRAVDRVLYLLAMGKDDEGLNLFDDLANIDKDRKETK